MPKRSIWEVTGLPDDLVWYAKRQRTSRLLDLMRRAVMEIRKMLRPYYMLRFGFLRGPYDVFYKSTRSIKLDYSALGELDYRGGIIRNLNNIF